MWRTPNQEVCWNGSNGFYLFFTHSANWPQASSGDQGEEKSVQPQPQHLHHDQDQDEGERGKGRYPGRCRTHRSIPGGRRSVGEKLRMPVTVQFALISLAKFVCWKYSCDDIFVNFEACATYLLHNLVQVNYFNSTKLCIFHYRVNVRGWDRIG